MVKSHLQKCVHFHGIIAGCVMLFLSAQISSGQQPYQRHALIRSDMRPGAAADASRLANPALNLVTQPVRLIVPAQARIEIVSGPAMVPTYSSRVSVGMRVGPVYRFQVNQIPRLADVSLYPSIELLNKMNPPAGLETQFPIQINISQDDLEHAAAGRMVTKVIYLEDPEISLPHRHVENDQPFFDIGGGGDPLRAAERLGRPLAILRIGSRVPLVSDDPGFDFFAPTPQILPDPQTIETSPNWEGAGSQKNTNSSSVIRASYRQENQSPAPSGFSPRGNYQVTPSDSIPAAPCCGQVYDPENEVNPWHPNSQKDEYVFDGGDRAKKVRVDQTWNLTGLDTEDTIGHFDTLDGRRIVTPSNQVAIYAPRFAAVRHVYGLFNAQSNVPVGSMEEKTMVVQTDRTQLSVSTKQHLAPARYHGGHRASGLQNRTRGVNADNVTHLFGFRNTFSPYENLSLIRLGKYSDSESARLKLGIQSANVWQDNLGLQIVVDNAKPVIVNDVAKVQQLTIVDSGDGADILRVTKVASRIAARPGQKVEFTIRFDNLTGRRIGNVTLIDNLTRRLEYVPDSAECSIKSEFYTRENESGSLMLRWEVTDPLPANSGGIIRFQCRVR